MPIPSAAADLRQRARAPDAIERADIPWLQALSRTSASARSPT